MLPQLRLLAQILIDGACERTIPLLHHRRQLNLPGGAAGASKDRNLNESADSRHLLMAAIFRAGVKSLLGKSAWRDCATRFRFRAAEDTGDS